MPETSLALPPDHDLDPEVTTSEGESAPKNDSAKDERPVPASREAPGPKPKYPKLSKRALITYISSAVLLIIIVVAAVTSLKYPLLSLVHKDSVTVTVTDDSTHMALAGVQVQAAGHVTTTNKKGQATLSHLPLGPTSVTLSKPDYRTAIDQTTLLWKPADLGTVALHSTGLLIKFAVTDWVSEQAIEAADITIASDTGSTSATGAGTVSIDPGALSGASATIKAGGYTTKTVAVSSIMGHTNAVTLVPTGTVYYFSNSTGKINLYSSNLDGSDPTDVLPGTGNEDAATGLLPSIQNPSDLAIVSSRAGNRDVNGDLEHDLYLFNAQTNTLKMVDTNVEFTDFRGWMGETLVYLKENSTGSTFIKAFDLANGQPTTLYTLTTPTAETAPTQTYTYANLTGLGIVGQKLYYSVDSSDSTADGFYSIGLSGGPTKLNSLTVQSAYRQTMTTADLEQQDAQNDPPTWTTFNFSTGDFTKLPGAPANENDRGYALSPDAQHAAFIETRDGNSQLYITDGSGNNEQAVTTSGDVNQFVQWYDNRYVAFTTNKDSSAIDIVAVTGGAERKVTDFFQGNGVTYGGGYNPTYVSGQQY
ncbi:MAG TPA: carboxypeptidase regulatory-like domain-containing protein [Candidatus Saccharimonadia bacterium]|nr:carboxypeptidase regulatory-like domain-containing protein [Candidatus Saccharimonadia bacterium]